MSENPPTGFASVADILLPVTRPGTDSPVDSLDSPATPSDNGAPSSDANNTNTVICATSASSEATTSATNGAVSSDSSGGNTTNSVSIPSSGASASQVRRSNRGKGKALAQAGLDEKVTNYTQGGLEYTKEDTVYLEDISRPDRTYNICMIEYFRLSRRLDCMQVHVKMFYRKSEVPENLYSALCERESVESLDITFADPSAKHRELLISEACAVMPVSSLRGKCKVDHYSEMKEAAKNFSKKDDNFFFVFSYNPETRRLASTRIETRVGPRYQVELPKLRSREPLLCAAEHHDETGKQWEELRWAGPDSLLDDELVQYLRAARSIAAFHGLCDLGSPAEGKSTAELDTTTQYAYDMLHDMDYNRALALMVLARNPYPQGKSPRLWTHDDVRAFSRAMRLNHKNFYRMQKECLPHKSVKELILFYYLWKKTSSCSVQKKSQTRSCTARRKERSPTPTGSNSTANSDAEDAGLVDEENEEEEEEDESTCRNCLVELRAVTPAQVEGEDSATPVNVKRDPLCADCRLYYQKYGQDRPADTPDSQRHFRPIREVDEVAADTAAAVMSPSSTEEDDEDEDSGSSSGSSSEDSDDEGGATSEGESDQPTAVVKQEPLSPVKEVPVEEDKIENEEKPAAEIVVKQEKEEQPPENPEEEEEEPPYMPVASPLPQSCSTEFMRTDNVLLYRVWNRSKGLNSCARVDLVPRPNPSGPFATSKLQRQQSGTSRSSPEPAVKRERRSSPPTPVSEPPAVRPFDQHSAQHLLSSFARPHLMGGPPGPPGPHPGPFGPPAMPPGADPAAYYRHLLEMGRVPPGADMRAGADPRMEMERKYQEFLLEQQQIQEMMLRGPVPPRTPLPPHHLDLPPRGPPAGPPGPGNPQVDPMDHYSAIRQLALAQHHHHNHTHLHLHQPAHGLPPAPPPPDAFEYYRLHAEAAAAAASAAVADSSRDLLGRGPGPPQGVPHGLPPMPHPGNPELHHQQMMAAAMGRLGAGNPMMSHPGAFEAALMMEQQIRAMGLPPH